MNPESRKYHWNPHSKYYEQGILNPVSGIRNRQIVLDELTWCGVGWCVCGVGIVSIQIKDRHTQLRLRSLAALSRHALSGTCRWRWYGFLPRCFEQ